MKQDLSEMDRNLLELIQKGLPLCERPFRPFADDLGISEGEALERLKSLKETGYIRRLGGVFSSRNLGYLSTLVAARVDEDQFYAVAKRINDFPGVTHNYRRNHRFNMWFTVIAETEEEMDSILDEVKGLRGVGVIRRLPAERKFKLRVDLDMKIPGEE